MLNIIQLNFKFLIRKETHVILIQIHEFDDYGLVIGSLFYDKSDRLERKATELDNLDDGWASFSMVVRNFSAEGKVFWTENLDCNAEESF